MKYKAPDYIAHEALTLDTARCLATIAGWQIERRPELLSPPFTSCFYVSAADLILVPCAGDVHHGRIEAGLAKVRCDAVVVGVGIDERRQATTYISLARCQKGQIHWHRALRHWEGEAGAHWLVPDPDGDEPHGASFRLHARHLRPVDNAPWASSADLDAGFRRAATRMRRFVALAAAERSLPGQ